LTYSPWVLNKGSESKIVKVIDGKLQGNSVITHLDGVTDREQAIGLMGWDVLITPSQLPATKAGEYYWSDLIGLHVENLQGLNLGVIENLIETGANDVLIIRGDRERAIPFLQGHTIFDIDLNQGKMLVDWDAEF